ncbi:MAG: TetR family transcriptional regulator [Actinobacteria bacterium]|nr:TetR family transcriptional regulator [Actinomycetota bacterium]
MEAEQSQIDVAEAGEAVALETAPAVLFDFDNPLSDLPEVARKLLLAAKSIVADQGFDALSLNSISEVSGENKAMISYYFGGKAGLIAAVLDSVIHDEYLTSVARMNDVEPGERVRRMIEEMRSITAAHEEFRVFFELLPVALRNEMLRKRIALLYEWYRSEKLGWLGVRDVQNVLDDPEILGLSQLLSAFIDGIAIQTAIDPDLDLTHAYAVLSRMIESCFPQISSGVTTTVDEGE